MKVKARRYSQLMIQAQIPANATQAAANPATWPGMSPLPLAERIRITTMPMARTTQLDRFG